MRRDIRRSQSALYGYLGPMLCMDTLLLSLCRKLVQRDPINRLLPILHQVVLRHPEGVKAAMHENGLRIVLSTLARKGRTRPVKATHPENSSRHPSASRRLIPSRRIAVLLG